MKLEKNIQLREKLLDLMERNLEIRLKIYSPVKETFFEKLALRIRKFFKL